MVFALAGAQQFEFGPRSYEAFDGVKHIDEVAPVRGDESGPDLSAPVLVLVPYLSYGDVKAPLQFGEQGPDHGAFLLQAVHVAQQDVEFNPSDPHGLNAIGCPVRVRW